MHFSQNSNLYMRLIFLEAKNAFDSREHCLLLQKISYNGSKAIWIEQMTRYNDHISVQISFETGVAQGSCLGPIPFQFYGVFKSVGKAKISMFAEDCVLHI